MEDQNTYFRAIINDAIDDVKKKGIATVFSREQAEEVAKEIGKDRVVIKEDEGFFKIKYDK